MSGVRVNIPFGPPAATLPAFLSITEQAPDPYYTSGMAYLSFSRKIMRLRFTTATDLAFTGHASEN